MYKVCICEVKSLFPIHSLFSCELFRSPYTPKFSTTYIKSLHQSSVHKKRRGMLQTSVRRGGSMLVIGSAKLATACHVLYVL